MAIINQQQPQAPQAAPGAPPPAPGGGMDAKWIEIGAGKIIHNPQISQQLLQTMKAAGDPATALAQAATIVMRGLAEKIQKSGKQIPPEAVIQALPMVIAELAQLAQAAQLFEVNEQVIQQAAQKIKADIEGAGQPAQPGAPPAQPAAPMAAPPQQPPMGA